MSKILYISASPNSNVSMGIITKYLSNLWSSLPDSSVDILGFGHKNSSEELSKNINIIPIPGFWGSKESQNAINSYLNNPIIKNKYDYIFAHGDAWYYNNIDLPLSKTKNVLYLNIEGEDFPERHWQVKMWDKIVFPLNFGKRACLKTLPKINQTEVIPHFVDETIFKIQQSIELENIKQERNAPLILGYVGTNSGRKNLYTLLQLISELSHLNIELWMVTENSTPDGINIQEVASQFNIINKIRIFPRLNQEELVKFYNSIDVYVSTSLSEAFGLPIIEAQSCGVPVVVSNIGAHREIAKLDNKLIKTVASVSPNSSGMVLKFSDLNNLKQHILSIYNLNKNAKLKMKNEERIKIRESVSEYFWSNVKEKWLHVFDNIEPNKIVRNLIDTKYRSYFILENATRNNDFISYRSIIKNIKNKYSNKTKFLCIYKDGNFGDILGTLPLLEKLKEKYPDYVTCLLNQSNQVNQSSFNSLQTSFLNKFYDFSILLKSDFINYDIQLYDLFDIFIIDKYICKDLNENIPTGDWFSKYHNYYDGFVSSNSHLGSLKNNVIELGLNSLGLSPIDSNFMNKIKNRFNSSQPEQLVDKSFIFMDNVSNFSPSKQMSDKNYTKLQIELLEKYPDLYIVQNNQNPAQYLHTHKNIINIHLSVEELVWCLRNSKLNITIENGISWFSYILQLMNKTIVLLSNTSDKVFDLGNINLTNNKCYPCWWSTFNWNKACLIGEKQCLNFVSNNKIIEVVSNVIK